MKKKIEKKSLVISFLKYSNIYNSWNDSHREFVYLNITRKSIEN